MYDGGDDMYNQVHDEFEALNKEYNKAFGRLYKTFDVRFIKEKIWETLSNKVS